MPPENEEFRFAAEAPLGGLARWLRVLGFDTLWPVDLHTEIERWQKSDRIPLRRTKPTGKPALPGLIFIRSDRPPEQVRQVVRVLNLRQRHLRPFSRCVRCNHRLRAADRRQVADRVPDYIFETHERFATCPGCRRIFWSGSHRGRVLEAIGKLVEG